MHRLPDLSASDCAVALPHFYNHFKFVFGGKLSCSNPSVQLPKEYTAEGSGSAHLFLPKQILMSLCLHVTFVVDFVSLVQKHECFCTIEKTNFAVYGSLSCLNNFELSIWLILPVLSVSLDHP